MPNYWPPEVLTQILSRLPVESAVRCTAVCKAWYALITDPSFALAHLQHQASLHDGLLLLRFIRDSREFYQLRRDNDAFEEYKQFHSSFQYSGFRVLRLVGTCNGLICLAKVCKNSCNIILWNPSIYKHFTLPTFDFITFIGIDETTLGFGFDSASNDYKVLLVAAQCYNEDLSEVWLFSLNKNSWTRLTEICPKHRCWGNEEAAFVRGTLHWGGYLVKDLSSHAMILAFDLSTEKFRVMNNPQTLVHSVPQMSLIKYEESIAVVTRDSSEEMDDEQHELWVLKEYNVDSSWTMVLRSIDKNGELVFDASLDEVFGVRKNGEVLVTVCGEENEEELATVNLNCHQQEHKQQLKRLIGSGNDLYYLFVGSYLESLVLLDKGENYTKGQSESE